MNLKYLRFLFLIASFGLLSKAALAQCGFISLASDHGTSDSTVTLIENEAGSVFTGSGISGNTFNPSITMAGTHFIMYRSDDHYTVDQSGTFDGTLPGPSVLGTNVPSSAGGNLTDYDDEISDFISIGLMFNFFATDTTSGLITMTLFVDDLGVIPEDNRLVVDHNPTVSIAVADQIGATTFYPMSTNLVGMSFGARFTYFLKLTPNIS